MKKLSFILLFIVIMVSISFAKGSYYIINTETNRASSKTNYLPNIEDLKLRNEIAVFSRKDSSKS